MPINATILGRLGHDPSVKETNGGAKLTEMSVACDVGYGDKKTTEWVKVAAFGKLGELCAQYLAKGRQAQFIGTLEVNRYTSKDGEPKAQLQLHADHVQFVGDKGGASEAAPRATASTATPDDGIPF